MIIRNQKKNEHIYADDFVVWEREKDGIMGWRIAEADSRKEC